MIEVTLWTDAARAALTQAVLSHLGDKVTPIALGGPREPAVDALAAKLDCPRFDDARQMFVDRPAGWVLMTSQSPIALSDLRIALDDDATVLSVEPVLDQLDQLGEGKARGRARAGLERVIQTPAFFRCPGWRHAAEPLELLGPVRLFDYHSLGPASEQSLFARLYEAWSLMPATIGPADRIDASCTGMVLETDTNLRQLTGRLGGHVRASSGGGAMFALSDMAHGHDRMLTLLGEQGQLLVTNTRYLLHDAAGKLLDQHEPADQESSFAALIAQDMARLMDLATLPPVDHAAILAGCQATLLSARTGQPERPGMFLELHRRGPVA